MDLWTFGFGLVLVTASCVIVGVSRSIRRHVLANQLQLAPAHELANLRIGAPTRRPLHPGCTAARVRRPLRGYLAGVLLALVAAAVLCLGVAIGWWVL